MNGYYLHFAARQESGVKNKIEGQLDQLRHIAHVTEISFEELEAKNLGAKLARRMPVLYPSSWDYEGALEKLSKPDFIYLRRTAADKYYINFMKELKKRFPKCKLLVEVPTYPYFKDDYLKKKNWPYFLKEAYALRYFKKYVDRFITYTKDSSIFGVNTICIMNGVDPKLYPSKEPSADSNVINMLAVATFRRHHGYERIIEGMYKYYASNGQRNIRLILVGEGPEVSKYKDLVKKYALEGHVDFAGRKSGHDLDEYYNRSDLGLGSFGFYKIGLNDASSLKTREYLSRGIPVISGCDQDVFDAYPCDFHLEFDNNNSVIDINKIIDFYDVIYSNNGSKPLQERKIEVIEAIHKYAEKYVAMEVAFAPVIDYLREELKGDNT